MRMTITNQGFKGFIALLFVVVCVVIIIFAYVLFVLKNVLKGTGRINAKSHFKKYGFI